MLDKIQKRLHELIVNEEIDNSDIIEIIKQLGGYLNLKTIAKMAKDKGIDYNCVKMSNIEKIELFGVKFVIDND